MESKSDPTLLAQTGDYWVIQKPSGWLCVPGRQSTAPVLIDWVRQELGQAWVCHRLDLETSGVWLVARSAEAHRKANLAFEKHQVRKQYLFLAEGIPSMPVLRLDAPIEGQKSLTQIEVRERFPEARIFLGLARPQSGRRHQIRIHLTQAGHPIYGDLRYQSASSGFGRTALHASVLELPTGERFEAPLPEDFGDALERLRKGAAR